MTQRVHADLEAGACRQWQATLRQPEDQRREAAAARIAALDLTDRGRLLRLLAAAAPPIALRRAIRSNGAVLRRAQAGVRYRFRVLASGLDEWQARAFEDAAIRRLKRPLNRTANARRWSDPLAGDPARGAVARFWQRRARDGDKVRA